MCAPQVGLTGPSRKDAGQSWVMLNCGDGLTIHRGVYCSWIVLLGSHWIYYWVMRGRHIREMVIVKGGGKFIGTYTKCSAVRAAGKVFVCKTAGKLFCDRAKGRAQLGHHSPKPA